MGLVGIRVLLLMLVCVGVAASKRHSRRSIDNGLKVGLTSSSIEELSIIDFDKNQEWSPSEEDVDKLEITFRFEGVNYTLDMERIRVTSRKYIEAVVDDGDLENWKYRHRRSDRHRSRRYEEGLRTDGDCHYHGVVRDYHNSLVSLSACELPLGVRAVVLLGEGKGSFEIVPVEEELSHVGFWIHDVDDQPSTCGHSHESGDIKGSSLVHKLESVSSLLSEPKRKQGRQSCEKVVEVLLINDETHHATHGAATESVSASVFAAMKALYAVAPFNCAIRLELAGQLTFRHGDPTTIRSMTCSNSFSSGLGGCRGLYPTFSLTENEIDFAVKLSDLGGYIDAHVTTLRTIFGGQIDNYQLYSGDNFGGSTVGYASKSSFCSGHRIARSVNMIRGISAFGNALTTTHEMGHNFGLEHVGTLNKIMSNVSCPSCPNAPQSPSADVWDSVSVTHMGSLVTSSSLTCLDNEFNSTRLLAQCGNGIVETGEECDVGFYGDGADRDACCSESCTLLPFCQCPITDPCCTAAGQFAPAGTVCRAALSVECDTAEVCSGSSSECPDDVINATGTVCGSPIVDSNLGVIQSMCYEGTCFEPIGDWNCEEADIIGTTNIYATYQRQFRNCLIWCESETNSNSFFTDGSVAPDGTPCAPGFQCSSAWGESEFVYCVSSANLSSGVPSTGETSIPTSAPTLAPTISYPTSSPTLCGHQCAGVSTCFVGLSGSALMMNSSSSGSILINGIDILDLVRDIYMLLGNSGAASYGAPQNMVITNIPYVGRNASNTVVRYNGTVLLNGINLAVAYSDILSLMDGSPPIVTPRSHGGTTPKIYCAEGNLHLESTSAGAVLINNQDVLAAFSQLHSILDGDRR